MPSSIYHSFFWVLVNKISGQILSLIFNVTLLFFLIPDDFGKLYAVIALTGFITLLREMALTDSVIKNNSNHPDEYKAINVAVLVFSLTAFIFFVLIAYLSPILYNDPQLKNISMGLYIPFVFQGFYIVPRALTMKNNKYQKIFSFEIWALTISGIICLYFAYQGFGVLSLVIKLILYELILLFLYLRLNWVGYCFSIAPLIRHFKYSIPILGSNTIHYLARNVDDLLIGNQLGTVALGLYNRAYSFTLYFLPGMISALNEPFFTDVTNNKNSTENIAQRYLVMMETIGFLVLPLAAFLFLFTKPLFNTFLDPQWMDTISLIKVFAVIMILQSFSYLNTVLYKLMDKTLDYFITTLITKLISITLIVLAVFFFKSLFFVALSYAIGVFISTLILTTKSLRLISLKWNNFLYHQWRNFVLTITGILVAIIGFNIIQNFWFALFLYIAVIIGLSFILNKNTLQRFFLLLNPNQQE